MSIFSIVMKKLTYIFLKYISTEKMTEWCKIKIDDTFLKVNHLGHIQRLMKSKNWKIIDNYCNHMNGMNVILVNNKQFTRSKILGCAYYNLDINSKYICKFKDKDRMNCNINNLQFIEI